MRLLITIIVVAACMHAKSQEPNIAGNAAPAEHTRQHADLLRFINSDTLHGVFHGFSGNQNLEWKSPEASAPISFSTKKIHRITLKNGHAKMTAYPESIVTLSNGDIVHGKVTSINTEQLRMKTEYLGEIQIPKNLVSSVTFQPHGGKLKYYGPLNTDGWQTIATKTDKKAETEKGAALPTGKDPEDQKTKAAWKHISNAWYSGTQDHHCLVRDNALPEICRLSFEVAWQESLYMQIGFFADLSPPEQDQTHYNISNHIASAVGNSYTLYVQEHSINLYAHSFDKDGKLEKNHIEGSASINLRGREKAHLELRLNRTEKLALLYVDGVYKIKWPLDALPENHGKALAFFKPAYNNRAPCQIRIKDITISEWNGLQDSARSTRNKDHDIVMLVNGLDRFSGIFNGLEDGFVSFTGSYGNHLEIPSKEIAEVNYASKNLHTLDQKADQPPVYFYTLPYGRISATPVENQSGSCTLYSEVIGEIELDTDYVNIIDFSHQNNLLDFWDDNF